MSKRCFDIIASLCGLLVLSPLLSVVAIAIYTTDGAPVLFRQTRVGWRGRRFTIYKFRTMRAGVATDLSGFEAGNTSRVTWLGRLLRKSKLDELPQFWNVLRGDMSLVGPRPEVAQWVDKYPDRWAQVHQVRPGITDPASIVYRNEEEILSRAVDPEATYRQEILPRKLSLYEDYVRTCSVRGDLLIVLETIVAVFRPQRSMERP